MGTLELREEPSGLRHYLDGRAIHAGDALEFRVRAVAGTLVPEGWIRGRYEWNFRVHHRPVFYVVLGEVMFCAELHEEVVLRWPEDRR